MTLCLNLGGAVKTPRDNALKGEHTVRRFSCNSVRDDGFQFYIKLYL